MIYESASNRLDQDLCQWMLEYHGYQVRQTRTTDSYDMAVRAHGRPYALVEYKTRAQAYREIIIDKTKIDGLLALSAKYRVQPWFMVHWPQIGGYWVWVCHKRHPVDTFTRKKRRGVSGELVESPDLVYRVPREEFNLLKVLTPEHKSV